MAGPGVMEALEAEDAYIQGAEKWTWPRFVFSEFFCCRIRIP